MRKTIIFGTIAALFGLVTVAQASSDKAKPATKDGAQITQKAETEGRGEKAEVKKRERAEYGARERNDDAREKGKEVREREDRD
jgi:hypothetical protein